MEPNGVTPDLLKYMKTRIVDVHDSMNYFDEECLNSSDEKFMDEMDRKFKIENKVLNLIYKLSKSNDYIQ